MLSIESFKKLFSLSLLLYMCVFALYVYILHVYVCIYVQRSVFLRLCLFVSLSPPLSGSLDVG